MNKLQILLVAISMSFLLFSWTFFGSKPQEGDFTERVKISLRAVGNQLLISNKDTTSLVMPIRELMLSKYSLEFKEALAIHPDNLVGILATNLQNSKLPKHYRVEVIQCNDGEVAYSYEMNVTEENTIIPCSGRMLPEGCYTIELRFLNSVTSSNGISPWFYVVICLLGVLIVFIGLRKSKQQIEATNTADYASLGSFEFYPEQNKLIKAAVEIPLSKKECELLALFVAQPNQVIRRDELTKKVWEDNGVVVGRSLDTYISKLRKKLQDDDGIKITNVHGVGYKLEVHI